MWPRNAIDAPPVSARTSTRPRSAAGSWARAASSTSMWSAADRGGRPGAQHPDQGLPGATLSVVDEGEHRVEPVAAFERGRGELLVRVRGYQRGVQVHDHLTTDISGQRPASRPDPLPSRRPGAADRRGRGLDIAGQRRDQPRDCRIGGHLAEQQRLGADRGDVGQAVAA
jgi:hypothetical protein